MEIKEAADKLFLKYGSKNGVPRQDIESMIASGVENYGLTVTACYNGLRMILGNTYNEKEFFTTSEVAEMMGTTEEKVNEETRKKIKELEENGEDVSQYFIPAHQEFSVNRAPGKGRGQQS